MSTRPPLLPHDTLQIHCLSCGRFLQAWVYYHAWWVSGQGPLPAKTGKGVRVGDAKEDFEYGGGGRNRMVLLHRCRAHNGRELPTVVRAARVEKHMDAKERRVDW